MLISKENSVLNKQTAGVQEFSKADLSKKGEQNYEKKNVSNRSSSSSNNYDDDQPGYGRGF